MHEILNLNPNLKDMRAVFETGFVRMTDFPISFDELVETRLKLIKKILQSLTAKERQFLLSLKAGIPDWTALPIAGIEKLPAINWKLLNIKKMNKQKHKLELEKLKNVLEI